MNYMLKLEELAELVLGIALFGMLDYDWWLFPALIMLPDLGMAGYLVSRKTGAYIYNLFHHKAVAIAAYLAGLWFAEPLMQLTGVIMFSHSALDRIFGYGLKYTDTFTHTHLGWIGNRRKADEPLKRRA